MNELISILMPLKNGSKYLDETLESIRHQSIHNWELIIIDDHSTDESYEMIQQWTKQDDRIRMYGNRGKGIIDAFLMALSMANGSLITRMDADDIMHERRLEMMAQSLNQSSEKTVITGLVRYFSDEPVSEGYLKYESWLNAINLSGTQWQNIYRECVIASPNWMMRKEELVTLGGIDSLGYPEDYHLTLLLYQNEFQIKCIPEVTLLWREHPERTSRNSINYDQAHFFALKIKTFLEFEWNGATIIIWGKNTKQKLTSALLTKHKIDFEVLDFEQYQSIEDFQESQLLVAIYPEEHQREALEQYLEKIYRKQGEDWWYL